MHVHLPKENISGKFILILIIAKILFTSNCDHPLPKETGQILQVITGLKTKRAVLSLKANFELTNA